MTRNILFQRIFYKRNLKPKFLVAWVKFNGTVIKFPKTEMII